MPVRPLAEHTGVDYDLMIVATLELPGPHLAELEEQGVSEDKLFPLRRDATPGRQRRAAERAGVGNGRPDGRGQP
jgi:hypothetical protein